MAKIETEEPLADVSDNIKDEEMAGEESLLQTGGSRTA